MGITQEFEKWMVTRANLSPNTATQYRRRLVQAFKAGVDPKDLSPRDMETFVEDAGGGPGNNDAWVGALKRYQDFLKDRGYGEFDFTSRLQNKRRPERLPRPVEFGDLFKLLESVPLDTLEGARDRAIMELLYCSLRNDETCRTNVDDFHNQEVRVIGKGNKERIVPINDEAWYRIVCYAVWQHLGVVPDDDTLADQWEELRQLADPETPMFLMYSARRIQTKDVREILRSRVAATDLTIRITPHMLRHSFATHVLDAGAEDLIALRDIMGHSNLETTMHYTKVTKKSRNRVVGFHPRQRRMRPDE